MICGLVVSASSNWLSVHISFQPLRKVPKLYCPSVACPCCHYPNDESFCFCQQCGYARQTVSSAEATSGQLNIDEAAIARRMNELSQQRLASRYSKQKSALELELIRFLRNLTPPKSIVSALPAEVIGFLIWKDKNGRTQVHEPSCTVGRSPKNARGTCECPKRLAFGTVDSLIGKLRAIFANAGRGSEWHSLLGVGNPAACRTVRNYLADVREEQLKARVLPRQAEPVLVADLEVICKHLHEELCAAGPLSATQLYILARDQAVFKALFFAGDRAADLFQLKTSDVYRMPDNSGLLLNHYWTKTLREGDVHVFAFKRGKNKTICPVQGIELYVNMCGLLKLQLSPGFLFRSVSKSGGISCQGFETAAAQARLDNYTKKLKGQLSGERFTMHGFRSGAAVSLALAGVEMRNIMDHIGWRSSKTALHYIKVKQVMNPAGAASVLADLDPQTGQTYKDLNNLRGFVPLFN